MIAPKRRNPVIMEMTKKSKKGGKHQVSKRKQERKEKAKT